MKRVVYFFKFCSVHFFWVVVVVVPLVVATTAAESCLLPHILTPSFFLSRAVSLFPFLSLAFPFHSRNLSSPDILLAFRYCCCCCCCCLLHTHTHTHTPPAPRWLIFFRFFVVVVAAVAVADVCLSLRFFPFSPPSSASLATTSLFVRRLFPY